MEGTKLPGCRALVVSMRPKLVRYFENRVGRQDAEDCAQRALLAFIKHGGKDRHSRPFEDPEAYLWGIAHGVVRTSYKERARLPEQLSDNAANEYAQPGSQRLEAVCQARQLVGTMATDEQYRELYLYETGAGVSELAQQRGCKPSSMVVELARTRKRFRGAHNHALREIGISFHATRQNRALPPCSARARG